MMIANAPTRAGQSVLARFVREASSPLRLLLGAIVPTPLAAVAFRLQ